MSAQTTSRKVAIVLSGCGVYDGSEIHEATSMLIHLSKAGAEVSFYAPNMEQSGVINHATGEAVPETRNVLLESARISRGNMHSLGHLKPKNFDALFIPGGFGAAKNLCDFASVGASCKVLPDIERVLKGFVEANKPIGVCCIAPILIAKCIPGAHVTFGTELTEGAAAAAKEMGAVVESCDIMKICVDSTKKIVSGPAYMCGSATIAQVFDNVGQVVNKTLSFIQ